MENFKKRLRNQAWWCAMIPLIITLIGFIAGLFGHEYDMVQVQDKLIYIVGIVFDVLAMVGVQVETSTPGLADKIYQETIEGEE